MPTTDTRCLHPPVGGEVGRAERDALHARGDAPQISSTLATPRAVSRMAWTRIGRASPAPRLQLGQQAIDVVDVLGALHLRHHDDIEFVADLGDQVVRSSSTHGLSRALTRVQSWVCSPKSVALACPDEPLPGGFLVVGLHRVLEVAEQHVGPSRRGPGTSTAIFGLLGSKKWIIRLEAGRASRSGAGGADGERGEEVMASAWRIDLSTMEDLPGTYQRGAAQRYEPVHAWSTAY